MSLIRSTLARTAAGSLAVLLLAACADAPTGANSFAHEAGGTMWVAVAPPDGLPDGRTWLPFLPPQSAEHRAVRALQDEAGRARRAGELERAAELEDQALRLAASSIAQEPPGPKVLAAIGALDRWNERAEERLATGSYPGLDSAALRVRALRNEARASLLRGETLLAVRQVTEAAEVTRQYAPAAVALRLVSACEQRIDAQADPSQNLKRARLLLRTAREAMATGDQTRAMKRAWYALQLIEAEERGEPAR